MRCWCSIGANDHQHGLRSASPSKIADDFPLVTVEGDLDADVLVIGWGSTWGAIGTACARVRAAGGKVANAHLTVSPQDTQQANSARGNAEPGHPTQQREQHRRTTWRAYARATP